jgi:hypothetical protein
LLHIAELVHPTRSHTLSLSYYCFFFLNIPIISQETSYRKIWLYDRGDYDKSKQYLSDVDWDSLISSNNVNDLTTNITNAILYAAEFFIN